MNIEDLKTNDKIKITPKEAQELCNKGAVLRLVDKTQKGDKSIKERDYEVLGVWEHVSKKK